MILGAAIPQAIRFARDEFVDFFVALGSSWAAVVARMVETTIATDDQGKRNSSRADEQSHDVCPIGAVGTIASDCPSKKYVQRRH